MATCHPDFVVCGALPVAPADVDAVGPGGTASAGVRSSAPGRRRFASLVITSANDCYVTPARTPTFATAWGGPIAGYRPYSRINFAVGFGPWTAGRMMLAEFADEIEARSRGHAGHGRETAEGISAAPDTASGWQCPCPPDGYRFRAPILPGLKARQASFLEPVIVCPRLGALEVVDHEDLDRTRG